VQNVSRAVRKIEMLFLSIIITGDET
jgi:hypothetical protein